MKILFKDQLGNRIIERSNGDIGLKNREGGNLWVHNNFLS